jgi:hypothetical protein
MTIHDKIGFKNTFATAIGGKGLILALALAGAGLQGCTTEDKATGPAGKDTPASAAIAEDDKGADLNADGSLVNPDNAASADSRAGLGKIAPSCVDLVTWSQGGARWAQAHNECGHNIRVRFIWRWNIDSDCMTMRPNLPYTDGRQWPSYLSELRSC